MSLDPPPSDAEIIRLAAERTDRRNLGRPREEALDQPAARVLVPRKPYIRGAVTLEALHTTLRAGEIVMMDGIISGAPRSKKNHKTHYAAQAPGYRHWRRGIITELIGKVNHPMPDRPYNLEAHFYVDSKGVPADLLGLLQGFADALEDAGVVSDDHWFRGLDRSRKHDDDQAHPRAEFIITPLEL